MKKLKRFVLNQNRQLTLVEMSELNGGGDVYYKNCQWKGQACYVSSSDSESMKTGICVPASYNPGELVCNTDL